MFFASARNHVNIVYHCNYQRNFSFNWNWYYFRNRIEDININERNEINENKCNSKTCEKEASCVGSKVLQCWSCEHFLLKNDQAICQSCATVQPVCVTSGSFFDLFGMPVKLADLDLAHLKKRYHVLCRALHPDKFYHLTKEGAEEQKAFSANAAARINLAYTTLQKPNLRAQYIAELHGVTLKEGETLHDPQILSDIMELREEADNITNDSNLDRSKKDAKFHSLISSNQQKITGIVSHLDTLFATLNSNSKTSDGKKKEEVKEGIMKLQYYQKLQEQLQSQIGEKTLFN